MSKISRAQFNQIIEHELPWATDAGMWLQNIEAGKAVMKLPYHHRSVRRGGSEYDWKGRTRGNYQLLISIFYANPTNLI